MTSEEHCEIDGLESRNQNKQDLSGLKNEVSFLEERIKQIQGGSVTFKEYQDKTETTAIYPREGNQGILYCGLKLAGEAGEVAQKIGKVMRDKKGIFDEEVKLALAAELGDVLWYVSQLSKEIGKPLEHIAFGNLEKLRARKEQGTLQGSGDER